MDKTILIIILFFTKISLGQVIKVSFYEENTNLPLANVKIYENERLIATTNKQGTAELDTNNSLNIIKEDYYDITISPVNNEKYFLKKIQIIEIEGVIVKEKTVNEVLDSLYKTITSKVNLYNSPKNTHFYNLFKSKNDTLHYFNNRLFRTQNNILTDNQNKIIKKFKFQNNQFLYNFKNKSILFYRFFTFGNAPYNDFDVLYICKNQNRFDFNFSSSDDDKFIISFTPKKNNTEYPFIGRLVLDRNDLGIYEFYYNSKTNKTIRTSPVINNKFYSYQIINENTLIQYKKNNENKYDLITYNHKVKFTSQDKTLKNEIFEVVCIKEPTTNISDASNLKKLNLLNFEIN